MSSNYKNLPYDPTKLTRELKKFYISTTAEESEEMMKTVGLENKEDLFSHIPDEVKFENSPTICETLSYEELINDVENIAKKNNIKASFIGDGLKDYKVPELIPFVCGLRGLTTAYTPYQPERSQGTLSTLWIYSSSLSMLTGFEAINASMYERSTCLFEALNTSMKLVRKTDTVLVCESIYPGDMEVLKTMTQEYPMNLEVVPLNKNTGLTDLNAVKDRLESLKGKVAALAFPQVNSLGNLEDVNALTDLCSDYKIKSIAIFDPMLLATKGLLPPAKYGSENQGADIIVGEGQHLAIGPNYGGPGLGIFGIRYNNKNKNSIRSTPGRYIGKGVDSKGKDCFSIILSTREQHIRREKATSNICSNQSFVATLAGAGILARGEKGMMESCQIGRKNAVHAASALTSFKGVRLAFPNTPVFNEFCLRISLPSKKDFIKKASDFGLHIGVDVTERINEKLNRDGDDLFLLISFFDTQSDDNINKLISFFESEFGKREANGEGLIEVPRALLREDSDSVGLPNFSTKELKDFYTKLNSQNVSPDENIYPLGSCTMKYNPYINDYAAGLKGFTDLHPQAPDYDAQGSLEIIYQVQELFKSITGLQGVTTQPVAGAQGELVGIKMFQAYHLDHKGENDPKRDIILIPHSAHGTNPATATMAGFETKKVGGVQSGIVLVEADAHGEIDMAQLKELVKEYDKRIAGIMVTNPNTSGIFERNFKEMADLIHSVGGLVYMDGANMNAIAGHIDLGKMGVDAVHQNLHKTWSIPHGGGGPGAATVCVSEKLVDYLPGIQVRKNSASNSYESFLPSKSIGSVHRHYGNFAHLVRCYTYIKALGSEGVREMANIAVLSARYLFEKVKKDFPFLPEGTENVPRMHEFIITLSEDNFNFMAEKGTSKAQAMAKLGKLFLDFGMHAPTVAFPEVYGLMIEPTESFNKKELDRFVEILKAMKKIITETPEVLTTVPHFTPVGKVDEVMANKNILLSNPIKELPPVLKDAVTPAELQRMKVGEVCNKILRSHEETQV
jgi:glycine dehydrogenase